MRARLRPTAVFAAFLLVACSSGREAPSEAILVEIAEISADRETGHPLLVLREAHGGRELPIWIGEAEARSIAMRMLGIETPRPNSHDLARTLIVGSGGRVERVVVNDLRDGVYYARLVIVRDGVKEEIDARPSDAMAIAVRSEVPIYVAPELFTHAGRSPGLDERPGDRQVPSRSL